MSYYFDVFGHSLCKTGEELCGDRFKVYKDDERTIIVLSDGLGSGVKANILATMTSDIILTLLKNDVELKEVIHTVIGTLPVCKVRKIGYATFTFIEIRHKTNQFQLVNFDNPSTIWIHKGSLTELPVREEYILEKKVRIAVGEFSRGDFLGMMTDGVLYAGMGTTMNFGWGWKEIARFVEGLLITGDRNVRKLVQEVLKQTRIYYRDQIGDDATFTGIYVRDKKRLVVFTGPPVDPALDRTVAERVLNYDGRKVVCGGTSGNIIAKFLDQEIETITSSMTHDIPPIGKLDGLDLLTEGIVTLSNAMEFIRESGGDIYRLPSGSDGASLLAQELMAADRIRFLVGLQINHYYQNPILPKTMSIRKNLIRELMELLQSFQKQVFVDYY
ncbi:MAG: serine/threonine-protein phosphatase [Bacteroidetes bacterium]|nr:serine/threonine-protein phosphatase [Bacteroidota bacterium]